MAKLIYKEFAGVGKGFEVASSIPPAGLVSVLRAARQGERNKFRYSLDDGQTFTDWLELAGKLNGLATVFAILANLFLT
jgi:hypothetical protein